MVFFARMTPSVYSEPWRLDTTQVGTQAAVVSGCLLGFVFFIAFSAYALALWYGSVRIIAGAMNGGDVVTARSTALRSIIFSVQRDQGTGTTPNRSMSSLPPAIAFQTWAQKRHQTPSTCSKFME